MQCQEIQDLLSAYLDGMLDPSEKDRAERHIEHCPACRSEFDDLKMVVELVRALPGVDPPKGFRGGLRSRLESQASSPVKKAGFLTLLTTGKWSGIMAVAASFVLVIGLAAVWYGAFGNYGMLGRPDRAASYDTAENKSKEPTFALKEQEGAQGRLPVADVTTVPPGGALQDPDKKADRQRSEVTLTMSSSSQPPAEKAPPSQEGEDLTKVRKIAVENGTAGGIAARGVAAATAAPPANQPRQAALDIKIDQNNADFRGVIESIARKYGGVTVVLPESGGKEIILKVPDSQFEKALADIGKTGTVVRQDFSPLDVDVMFMMVAPDGAAGAQDSGAEEKGGAPGVQKAPLQAGQPGETSPEVKKDQAEAVECGTAMATIKIKLE